MAPLFVRSHFRDMSQKSEPAIAGSRIPGYVAVRIFAPMHDPEPPELAASCDVAARHGSRPASSGKLPRRPGESGITHSQH